MKEKLAEFTGRMALKNDVKQHKIWWYVPHDLPSHDFNKEVVPPAKLDAFPMGATGIRVDDDFWAVAALPYEFKDMSIEDIVEVLWPDVDATFNPDSDAWKYDPRIQRA